MHDFVYFHPANEDHPVNLTLTLTKKPLEELSERENYAELFRQMTDQDELLILPPRARRGEAEERRDGFRFFLKGYEWGCHFKEEVDENGRENYAVLVVYRNDLRFVENNIAMQDGKLLVLSRFTVEFRGGQDAGSFSFRDGEAYERPFYEGHDDLVKARQADADAAKDAIATIRALLDLQPEAQDEDVFEPGKGLTSMLEQARQYADIESAMEQQKVRKAGSLHYVAIEAAAQDRIDRVAIAFVLDKDELLAHAGTGDLNETQLEYFAENAKVILDYEEDGEFKEKTATVLRVAKEQDAPWHIDLLFNGQESIETFPRDGYIKLDSMDVCHDVQVAAIDAIEEGEAPAAQTYLDKIFDGGRLDETPQNLHALDQTLQARKYPPTPSQMQAIHAGINDDELTLVMGPPGTGKTTVILEWVKYFVARHKRVLVTSQNNKAVDNVLERLLDEDGIDMIRIGSENKVSEKVKPLLIDFKVRDTRRRIAERASANILKAEAAAEAGRSLADAAEVAVDRRDATIAAAMTVQRGIDKALASCVKKLTKAYEEYQAAHRASEAQLASVFSWKKKAEAPHDNIFAKIFYAIPNLYYNSNYQDSLKAYRAKKEEEHKRVEDYEERRRQYEQVLESLRGFYQSYAEEKTSWREAYEEMDRARYDVRTSVPAEWPQFSYLRNHDNPDVPADTYDDSSDFLAWEGDDCLDHLAEIQDDADRLERLAAHLREWVAMNAKIQNKQLMNMALEAVDVVGATCIGVNSQKRFADLKFDVTIMDEAGQIQIHNAIVPLSRAPKAILLGDHKQIPPIADPDMVAKCEEMNVKPDLLAMSLFEYLYDDPRVSIPEDHKVMLTRQFRMPAEIANTLSRWFYGGRYDSLPLKDWESYLPELSRARYILVDTSEESGRYEQTPPSGQGHYNPLEAQVVSDIAHAIIRAHGLGADDIGVISAYKSQVELMREKMSDLFDAVKLQDCVATLDSFQGQERNVILYSFARSSRKPPEKARIGFLRELRRLNVAMSRCKKTLVLIGDFTFLSTCANVPEAAEEDVEEETMEAIDWDDEDAMDEEEEAFDEAPAAAAEPSAPAGSEKRFAAFIRQVLDDVAHGSTNEQTGERLPAGEKITVAELKRRLA